MEMTNTYAHGAPTPNLLTNEEELNSIDLAKADLTTTDRLEEEYFRESGAISLIPVFSPEPATISHIASTSSNVARFQERILAAVVELVDYPRQTPYPSYKKLPRDGRPMSTAFYTIFNTSSARSLTEFLLRAIPPEVREVFGKAKPTFEDLISLPEPTDKQRACWIVYFDGTIRWEMEDDPDDPFIPRKTSSILRRGKYVGSSVDYRGGGVRLDRHMSAANTKSSAEKKQLHHQELCQEGTDANLRILAVFDRDPRVKPYVPLLESIFMGLVGTFTRRESPGRHNPKPCYELYDRIRERANMPDIDGDGLNKALSIHQGMIGQVASRQTYRCMVCNRELKPDTPERDHARLVEAENPLGPRRCQTCHRHFTKHEEERSPDSVLKLSEREQQRKQHQLWVAAGNADIYGNPACAAPRVPGSSFTGFMTDARCGNCADYRRQQAIKNVPDSHIQERQPQPWELEARNHLWTQEEDILLRNQVTLDVRKTAWRKLALDHFPNMTAQSLKERFALLKAEDRKLTRDAPRTTDTPTTRTANKASKSRNWSDSELAILQAAMKNGHTAKSVSDLLPGRTLTAINSKLSWLRKASIQG